MSSPTSSSATASTGMSTTTATTGMVPPAASSIPGVATVSISLRALPMSLVAAILLGTLIILLRLEPIISIGVVCLLRVLSHVVILLHVKMHRRQLPVAHKTTGTLWLEFGIALEGPRCRTKASARV